LHTHISIRTRDIKQLKSGFGLSALWIISRSLNLSTLLWSEIFQEL
jgi:hypothetical protein